MTPLPPSSCSPEERTLRQELAACYRLVAHFRMTDLIFTHISVRLPGPEHHFLINPYGLMFDEIRASDLVKIDLQGRPVEPTRHKVNPAGFVIHSAIHAAREDARCVLHTHTRAGCAVAAQPAGLLPVNQISMEFYGRVAYHGYEGVALNLDEQKRLVADLGDKPVMILRNHGLLVTGASIEEACVLALLFERAAKMQLLAMSAGEI
ncbi:class II aldolase/adducin family protein, partial [Pseudomonas otitidis]